MKEQQGSSSVYRSYTLPFSQAGMLAIAGVSLISGLWIQLEALPLVTGTSQVSWDSLAWIQKWNVRLEPTEVLQSFEKGTASKDRLSSKHALQPHLKQRRIKVDRAREVFAGGTGKNSLVSKGDWVAKNFQKEAVLGKVRHDDEIHLNKAARGFADLESPGAGKDLTEQRKLMLMHRFLSLRMIVAVNALSIPASPEKDLVIAHQAREEEMRQNLIHDNSKLIHDKNRDKPENTHPFQNPAYPAANVNRKIATISPPSVALPKNGDTNPYESKNEQKTFDLSSTEQLLGKMILDATQSNLSRLKGELKGGMEKLSLEDQVMRFSQSMDLDSLPSESPEWWTTQRELATLTFDATRGAVQSLSGKDASVNFPKTAERNQMVAWNGYSSVPGVEQPLTIRAAGRVPIPSASSLVSQPRGQALSLDHRATSHAIESRHGPEKQSQPTQSTAMSESGSAVNPVDELPTFVEAFDSQRRRVEGVSARMLSSEVADGRFERGVGFAQEPSHHWATLDWYDPASNGPQAVPLVSINSLHYIAVAGGVGSQSEKRGFLFGKIARGWEIHSTDGGAQAVYLYAHDIKDSAGNVIRAEGTVVRDDELVSERNEERYYVLFNISPGAQWVQVSSVWGEGQAGVPVPVFGGIGTHRDLTQIAKRTFSGHVFLDGEEEDNPNPFPKYTIEVSGQPSFTAQFDFASTDFRIPNVITFGNYPFFIQVKSSERPQEIHQYKVLPSEMHDFTVYQISQFKVDQWVAQFQDERAMDESAGMKNLVIVAVPQLVKSNAPQELLPELSSLSSLEGKALKTFTIYPWKQVDSPYDEVKAGVSLGYQQNKKTRFIGSVPEGLVLPAIRDSNGNVLWSELTMTWPSDASGPAGAHVVNIIGPY